MHLMNELINNKVMDQAVKFDKLEALLSVAASLPDQMGIESSINDDGGLMMKDTLSIG
jgi:hypothetical protein